MKPLDLRPVHNPYDLLHLMERSLYPVFRQLHVFIVVTRKGRLFHISQACFSLASVLKKSPPIWTSKTSLGLPAATLFQATSRRSPSRGYSFSDLPLHYPYFVEHVLSVLVNRPRPRRRRDRVQYILGKCNPSFRLLIRNPRLTTTDR